MSSTGKTFPHAYRNRNTGASKVCYGTKRTCPKEGAWLTQGHTARRERACSEAGQGRALAASASPAPFLLTASPFSTSQFGCLELGAKLPEEG